MWQKGLCRFSRFSVKNFEMRMLRIICKLNVITRVLRKVRQRENELQRKKAM
jgi:hypothetical protein